MSTYIIRQATIGDVEIIRQLAADIWPVSYGPILSEDQIAYMLRERYSTEELTRQIQQNQQTFLLARDDTRYVGFASYSPTDDDAFVYRLHKLYCLPATHGKGYGKALLNQIVEDIRKLGAKTIELNVHRRNPAKTFYDKMGFEVAYGIDIPMGPYFLNDYIMRKQL